MTHQDQKNRIPFSDTLLLNIFDSLSAHIAILDDSGRILETNAAWRQFAYSGGMPEDEDFTRMNYLEVCKGASGEEAYDALNVARGIERVIDKEVTEFLYDYPCHTPQGRRWFYMRAILMADTLPIRVIISHEDITELKLTQEELKSQQQILEDQNQSLEEANIAMKVLLEHREKDKANLEQQVLSNIKTFVLPYIEKLKGANLSKKDKTLVEILEDQLSEVTSSFMQKFIHANIILTPQEMQVAALVRDGQTTADIAETLYISEATVSFHRKNIRRKLGLKSRQSNLRSFLLSRS
ncbi:MAG: helix-turn-helix transcriptional regulator [Desulfobacteraceae bacterium]|nr:MAG: helix-turn-helix transcriptional regulator [Desulfobacteraceae bacterium]